VPSSESWWDVPVSQVSELDSTQNAFKTYESYKARQRPYVAPAEGEDR
jgi:3D-(3,5/4)-trihydroxycyclohexane-1,2-dione acylhydrolase (decyclizing)